MKIKKTIIKLIISALLIGFKILYIQFAKSHPEIVEKYYSRGIYTFISNILTDISNQFSFSLGEILLGILVVGLLLSIVLVIRRIVQGKMITAVRVGANIVMTVVVISIFLDFAWLLNNYRYDYEIMSGLVVEKTSKEELAATYKKLVLKTNDLKAALDVYEEMHQKEFDVKSVLESAYEGYVFLHDDFPFISGDQVNAKGLFSSHIQTKSGYSGIYLFWIGEPTVNVEIPLFTLPHTACHEIAHQKGFAHEEEANYIGFLACKYNDSVLFQYSGYFSAMQYVGHALAEQDLSIYKEIASLCSKDVRMDIKYNYDFWNQNVNSTASKVADGINESYLKSYNQPEGLKSYGVFVDLLIADYLEDEDL